MTDGMVAETITISGHAGDEIEAYFARPVEGNDQPSVVVIHHMPGYDRATKEIVRTFAVYGYATLMPNLFHRYAPGAKAGDAAAAARDAGGVPDEQCLGDVQGAIDVEWVTDRILYVVEDGAGIGGFDVIEYTGPLP